MMQGHDRDEDPTIGTNDDGYTDSNMSDIPINRSDEDEEAVGASLPNADELKTDQATGGKRDCFLWTALITTLCIVCLVIGLSVGLATRDDESVSTSNSLTSAGGGNLSPNNGGATTTDSTPSTSAPAVPKIPTVDKDAPRLASVDQVIQYLSEHGVSNLEVAQSSQRQAAEWLAKADPANLGIPSGDFSTNEGYEYLERFVLTTLYYGLDGPKWKFSFNFLTQGNACTWSEVLTNGQTFFRSGVICNIPRKVEALALDYNLLKGSIPPEIGLMTRLETLDMSFNELIGDIPYSICDLTNLKTFSISFNDLSGAIPDCIGDLSNLEVLVMANNNLSEDIPPSFKKLHQMKYLFLDDNLLSGNITHTFDHMKFISEIFIEDNYLSGTLHNDFLANKPDLRQVDLSNNLLDGSVPKKIFQNPQLQVLDLNTNFLSGNLPAINGVDDSLLFLSLFNNSITGNVPTSWANFTVLFHLDLTDNAMSGHPPPHLGQMKALEYLFLANNGFNAAKIPDNWQHLVNMQEFSMKNTNLMGNIPAWLEKWSNLNFLDLDDNELTGSIPDVWSNMTNLEFLLLNRNIGLNGDVPGSMASLKKLRILFLERTGVTGSLNAVCALPTFQEKPGDLNGNEIISANCGGTTPQITCSCCELCCNPATSEQCNPFTSVASIDPHWEAIYRRVDFDLGNNTRYVDKSFFNLN